MRLSGGCSLRRDPVCRAGYGFEVVRGMRLREGSVPPGLRVRHASCLEQKRRSGTAEGPQMTACRRPHPRLMRGGTLLVAYASRGARGGVWGRPMGRGVILLTWDGQLACCTQVRWRKSWESRGVGSSASLPTRSALSISKGSLRKDLRRGVHVVRRLGQISARRRCATKV